MPATYKLLTGDEVLLIHSRLQEDFKRQNDPIGSGLRSRDLLESAIGRQVTGYAGQAKYNSICEVAATTFYGLAMNHAFIDGNKRTAVVALLAVLDKNLTMLEASEKSLLVLTIQVVEHKLVEGAKPDDEVAAIAAYLERNTRKIDKKNYPLQFRRLRQILTNFCCRYELTSKNKAKFVRGKLTKHVHYDGDGVVVSSDDVKDIRKVLQLDEERGIDSQRFYAEQDVVDDFINKYRTTLRSLSSYDKAAQNY